LCDGQYRAHDSAMSPTTPLTRAQTAHSLGTVIVSVALFLIVAAWLVVVGMKLGKVPIYDQKGTLQIDEFARTKDIFSLVLPFLTTVAGFWLGSQGTVQAHSQAAAAQEAATEARNQANEAQKQLVTKTEQMSAVVSYGSKVANEDILAGAKAAHGGLFPPV
jgi:hypothetical protein